MAPDSKLGRSYEEVRIGRPKIPLALSTSEREQLQGIGKSRSLPNGIVRRARMVLMSVTG